MGHDVKLTPAQFVRPYAKSNMNDAADAEAISEAVQRPGMRFAARKEVDVQAMLALHRTRRLLIKQRTQMLNSLRGQCVKFGVVALQTRPGAHRARGAGGDAGDAPGPDRQASSSVSGNCSCEPNGAAPRRIGPRGLDWTD